VLLVVVLLLLAILPARLCVFVCCDKKLKAGDFVATGLLALAITLEACREQLKPVHFLSYCE
jgi:hypothetical protein